MRLEVLEARELLSVTAAEPDAFRPPYADSADIGTASEEIPLTAPQNLRVVAAARTTLSIDWNNVNGAAEYILQRKGPGESDFAPVYTGSESKYVDRDLTAETVYEYRVQTSGSVFSAVLSTSTAAIQVDGKTVTDSPMILSSNYNATSRSNTLTWSNLGSEYVYTVYKAGRIVVKNGANSFYVDSGPSVSGVDGYTILAYNTTLKESSEALTSVVHSTAPVVEITGVEFLDDGSTKLLWDAQPGMLYAVMRSGRTISGAGRIETGEWIDTNPDESKEYLLIAFYKDSTGEWQSTFSNLFMAKRPISLPEIQLTTPILDDVLPVGSDKINVTWTAVSNAVGYTVQYATDLNFTANVGTVEASTNSATITGLDVNALYYVRVMATGTGVYYDSDYSAAKPAVTPLTLGTSAQGSLTAGACLQVYKLDVTESKPLSILLDGYAQGSSVRLYARYGHPPTQSDYAFVSGGGATSHQSITIPSTVPGALYIMVVGEYVPASSAYTLIAAHESLIVDSVSLVRLDENEPFTVTASGAGFNATTALTLVSESNGVRYTAQSTVLNSSTSVSATFSETVQAGTYKLELKNDAEVPVVIANAVTITAETTTGFDTNVILPSGLTGTDLDTIYVEYTNTGTVAMLAPLLTLHATSQGEEGAKMTLDANRLATGLATSTVPVGFSSSVQIYADGARSGILLPGETVRVPVYWAGWNSLLPDAGQIDFSLEVLNADNTNPLDFETLKVSLKPTSYTDETWDVVWPRLKTLMGSTWGDYVTMLGDIAASLGSTGNRQSHGVDELFSVAIEWANDGFSPFGNLVTSTDIAVSGPTGTLAFNRIFIGTEISSRHYEGDLGYGWDHNWNWSLDIQTNGDVILKSAFGAERLFQGDARSLGDFVSQPGDDGLLRLSGGKYTLTESNGTIVTFSAQGQLEKIADANGNVITVTYAGGKLSKLADAYGNSLTIAYNAGGKIESVTDNLGNTTTYAYDASGKNLVTATNQHGVSVSYTYATATTGPLAHTLSTITYADGNTQHFTYDSDGVLYETLIAGMESTSYVGGSTAKDLLKYEVFEGTTLIQTIWLNTTGQIAKATDSQGRMVIYEYDYFGRAVKISDETGVSSSMDYDLDGNLICSRNANGEELRYTYSSTGELLTLIDSRGNVTTFHYDNRGNLLGIERADGTSSGLTYNDNGTTAVATNRRGDTYTYTYDPETGRLIENRPSTAGNSIRYEYDERGNVVKITDENDGVTTMVYDANNQLTRIDYPTGKWIAYTYDAYGRQTSVRSGDEYHVKYTYNTLGLLESILDGMQSDKVVTYYEYDTLGRPTKETQGNGTYTIYSYDTYGSLLTKTDYDKNHAVLSRFEYTYNDKGLVGSMDTLDGSWTYGYDAIGQLTTAVFVSTNTQIEDRHYVYVYDAAGNRIETVNNGTAIVYETDEMNRYTRIGDFTYKYDADGNMIEKKDTVTGETWVFEWCQGNWLRASAKLDADGNVVEMWEYEYDAFGNRIAVIHNGERTEYLVDLSGEGNVIAEYDDEGNLVTYYVHGDYGLSSRTDADGNASYYGYDALGSTAIITDAGGTIVNQYVYDPFGQSLFKMEGMANLFQYVGRYGIMTGNASEMLAIRARWYDTGTGRFISEDPANLKAGDANLYRYCTNDPMNYIDVTGQYKIGDGLNWLKKNAKTISNIARAVAFVATVSLAIAVSVAAPVAAPGVVAILATLSASSTLIAIGTSVIDFTGNPTTGGGCGLFFDFMGTSGEAGGVPGAGFFSDVMGFALCPTFTEVGSSPAPTGQGVVAATADTQIRAAVAPISGPGYGEEGWVKADQVLPYQITFANLGSATADIQNVEIVVHLDADLDWSTFRLEQFGFGNTFITVPEEASQFSYTRTERNVRFSYTLDRSTGTLRITFEAQATTGVLAPDEFGFVQYTIKPKSVLATGTEITTTAEIAFDGDEPVSLGETKSTVDANPPTSRVTEFSSGNVEEIFLVQWSGSDVGSGVGCYDIYVSDNGGAFVKWLSRTKETSMTYIGEIGHTYSFFAVAYDNVGNDEAGQKSAEAAVTVGTPVSSTIIVTTLDDIVDDYDGVISLREAIDYAGTGDWGTTIVFSSSLNGTITLNGTQLYIDKNVTINATGASITIDADNQSRVFYIAAGATVTLEQLTITNGVAALLLNGGGVGNGVGGGIRNLGTLSVVNCVVTKNTAESGGGIYNESNASLSVTGGEITENIATYIGNTSGGGGIFSSANGTMTVTDCTISLNSATGSGSGGGGILVGYSSTTTSRTSTLTNCIIFGNNASGLNSRGGGIYNYGSLYSTLDVIDCQIALNTAGTGGGIYINAGTLNLTGGIITGNAAANGGGIYNTSTLTVTDAAIMENQATSGNGGGIYTTSSKITINSATITQNSPDNVYDSTGTITTYNLLGNGEGETSLLDTGMYGMAVDTNKLTAPTLGAVTIDGNAVRIEWGAVANASGYVIQHSTDPAFADDVVTMPGVSASTIEAPLTGLDAGTIYHIRIQAIGTGSYANSAYSGSKSIATLAGDLDAFWFEYGLNGLDDDSV